MNNSFIIDEADIEQAEKVCYDIEEAEVRKRAFANVLLARLAQKFFDSSSVDVESGIHNVSMKFLIYIIMVLISMSDFVLMTQIYAYLVSKKILIYYPKRICL